MIFNKYFHLQENVKRKWTHLSTQIIHGHIVKTGSHEDPFLSAFLIAKSGNIKDSKI
jgi:hypothetical protein